MPASDPALAPVSPARVIREIAAAVPGQCHRNMIIIGSLAVGHHYFGDQAEMVVRTKDADCLLSPRVEGIPAGGAITEQLFAAGWTMKEGPWGTPGNESTPESELPLVRLQPPSSSGWFLELLVAPESLDDAGRRWVRLETERGHFGLCSYRFLSLVGYRPLEDASGLRLARPEMMALANLLEHPTIGLETMSAGFAGRSEVKRSNKDLGRAIAIAFLATERNENAVSAWVDSWRQSLRDCFPEKWRELTMRVGQGLRELLASEADLEQAHHTCVNGLLASKAITIDEFRIAGQRLLADAVEPIERVGSE